MCCFPIPFCISANQQVDECVSLPPSVDEGTMTPESEASDALARYFPPSTTQKAIYFPSLSTHPPSLPTPFIAFHTEVKRTQVKVAPSRNTPGWRYA